MSSYTHFFIKTPDNIFLPIACFASSSKVAEYIDNAPFRQIRSLSRLWLCRWIEAAEDDIQLYDRRLQSIDDYVQFLERAQNPLDEKLDHLRDCQSEREDIELEKDEATQALRFLQLLKDICAQAEETKYWDYDKDAPTWRLLPDSYIYYGCECSNRPTMADVI